MSSNYAGIHFYCEDSSTIVEKLKTVFGKQGISASEKRALDVVTAVFNKSIAEAKDADEKAKKESNLIQTMQILKNAVGQHEPYTAVVREHFVSIYCHDLIRSESVRGELDAYVKKLKVPGIGVAVWQHFNFQIYAANEEKETADCLGEYYFDEDDITPVKAETICEVIGAPHLLEALQKVLSSQEGDKMAEVFEEETGLQIYMDEDMCREEGMKELFSSETLTIFLEP